MSAARWNERYEPGYARSFALAVAVHAVLLAVIVFGVQMQSHAPEAVTVELWEPPAAPKPKVEPAPKVEPPKPQPPKVEPEPPKPEPKIEKPDIVEKPAPKPRVKPEPKPKPPPPPPPKPKPKPEPKPKPKPKPKPEPKPKPNDEEFQTQLREQLAREQAAAQERQLRELVAREQAAARSRALAGWVDKIRAKIRGNIPLQVVQEVAGNPEAIYDVTLLPTGEVLTARLRQSSGNKAYDEAVERAILKSSPLPKPEQADLFRRQLELHFRPQDN